MSCTSLYLTSKEGKAFNQLDPELAGVVSMWLEQSDGVLKARKVLSTFLNSDSSLYGVITHFFLNMVKEINEERIFKKFSKIHERGNVEGFFEYAKTRSLQDLSLVVSDYKKTTVRQQMVQPGLFWKAVFQKMPFAVLERQRLIRCLEFFSSSTQPSELSEFIDEMKCIYHAYGEEFCSVLSLTIRREQVLFSETMLVLRLLHLVSKMPPLREIDGFVRGKISWNDLSEALRESNRRMDERAWDLDPFATLMQRFRQMPFPISNEGLGTIEAQFKQIQELCKLYENLGMEILYKELFSSRQEEMDDQKKQIKILTIGICSLRCHFGLCLHPTQVLTVLGLTLFSQGSLAQVKTGEGKSMIIALLAFLLAVQGKSVHIVSSASHLSIRDHQSFETFFSSFGITTACVADKNPPSERFKAQILYGTGHDFEFAIMREMLNVEHLFQKMALEDGEKRFDAVIIDEVDNLTIDTLCNEARMGSHTEISYDWVYAPILRFVQKNQQGTLDHLRSYLSEYEDGGFSEKSQALSNEQLQMWLRSAYHAQYELQEGKKYVILLTAEGKEVCIVDKENTGRLVRGSRWGGGIHEFIETKHSIPVRRETLTPLSLSPPAYYGMYRRIFGLSGTLGSVEEREEIKQIYQINTFDVPTFLPSKRKDFVPAIVDSESSLLQSVLTEVQQMKKIGRPILIICKSIVFSNEVSHFFAEQGIEHELFNEMQEKLEEVIIYKAGFLSAVTIATNTASRGTDIKLSQESQENGGLSVIATFFPKSLRIEEQIRGRAGRQGQHGSSKIIFTSSLNLEEKIRKRERRAFLSKEIHIYNARLARQKFRFAQCFFSRYALFHKSQRELVEQLAQQWTPRRRLQAQQPDLSNLPARDKALAIQVIHLLNHKRSSKEDWRVLIEAVHDRIDKLAIENWSRRFYFEIEHKFAVSGIKMLLSTKEVINNELFQLLIDVKTKEIYLQLCNEMQALFDRGNEEGYWNSYLSADGLNKYLKEIISGTR